MSNFARASTWARGANLDGIYLYRFGLLVRMPPQRATHLDFGFVRHFVFWLFCTALLCAEFNVQ